MKPFRDWSIRARFLLAFGGVLVLFVALTGVALVASHVVRREVSTIHEETALDLGRISDLRLAWSRFLLAMKDCTAAVGPKERMQVERQLSLFLMAFGGITTTQGPSAVGEEQQLVEVLRGMASQIEARSRTILAVSDRASRHDAVEELVRVSDRMEPVLQRLHEIRLQSIQALVQHASDMSRQAELMTIGAVLLGAAGAAAMGSLFSRWLSDPIQAITRGSRRMAQGDLSQRVDITTGGELGDAAVAFNEMAERLQTSAIENARLYDAAAQRTERIAAINRLIMVISSSLDLNTVYHAFAAELKQFLPFTRMGIIVPDPSGQRLRVLQLAAAQPGTAQVGKTWTNEKGTGIEWVMSHRQPHIEADLAEERLFIEDEIVLNEGMRSTVRLPLIVKGEVIGAIFLDDVEPGRYTERDLDLLVPLAEQMAIAIENARLHDELERKVEERTMALQETQAQLIQSGKLAAVGTLAAGVAHELNQPLMIIRGYAQELLADGRLVDEEVYDDLRRIESQTTRMTAIINHLRDFSRQSKGKRQTTDLNQVVTGALTFLEQQLKTRNIAIIRDLLPALPPVWADPMQIEQVLLNLITNARDAMEEVGMGTITIRTDLADTGHVRLSVTDTGPGIPADIRPRIFDPFFTTKEVGKGTGLGLSICHGIIEAHGGELTMESPVANGRGARFTIVLPCSLGDDHKSHRI